MAIQFDFIPKGDGIPFENAYARIDNINISDYETTVILKIYENKEAVEFEQEIEEVSYSFEPFVKNEEKNIYEFLYERIKSEMIDIEVKDV